MSLKLVPFESLGAVSYSPSIVTVAVSVAVCEIFSVKEWRDIGNQVRSRSRSLNMAPFDRPYATFYWSAIVNIALSRPRVRSSRSFDDGVESSRLASEKSSRTIVRL